MHTCQAQIESKEKVDKQTLISEKFKQHKRDINQGGEIELPAERYEKKQRGKTGGKRGRGEGERAGRERKRGEQISGSTKHKQDTKHAQQPPRGLELRICMESDARAQIKTYDKSGSLYLYYDLLNFEDNHGNQLFGNSPHKSIYESRGTPRVAWIR